MRNFADDKINRGPCLHGLRKPRYLRMERTGQVDVLLAAVSNVVDFLNWSVLEALMRTSIVSLVKEISLRVRWDEGSKAELVGVVNSLSRRNP